MAPAADTAGDGHLDNGNEDDSGYRALHRIWHPLWGYRRQELAIIGIGLDQAATTTLLDACLLDDADMAMGPQAWRGLADPFPSWSRAPEA